MAALGNVRFKSSTNRAPKKKPVGKSGEEILDVDAT